MSKTIKKYTLTDTEEKLKDIVSASTFVHSCAGIDLANHMHTESETLQSMLSFMQLAPEIKAMQPSLKSVTAIESLKLLNPLQSSAHYVVGVMLRVCLWPDVQQGWASELLIVGACVVHVRRENRLPVLARNIIPIMLALIPAIMNG